jgi:hypothetical protein
MNIHSAYNVFFRLFRPRRLRAFYRLFEISESTRILDLGGTLYWWELAGRLGLPAPRVTIVNLSPPVAGLPPNIRWLQADARALPFNAGSFDVVFSNSLIEHLYAPDGQARFAAEVQRVAARWWVQTVDFRCPVEPHYVAPFIHWLPLGLRRRVLRWCTPWGWIERPTQARCDAVAREIRILHLPEMRRLFPGSEIVIERLLGLPKSIIAIQSK